MKKIILSTAVISALLSMSTAYAGGSSNIFSDSSGDGATAAGLYGGASIGQLSGNIFEENSNKTSWKVFGGYKVAPHFSVEGAYIDFGSETFASEYVTAEGSMTGVSLMGVASAPVADNIDVFGKLGMLHWKATGTWQNNYNQTSGSKSVTGNDLAIGAGASVKVSDNIAIRGEVEHFRFSDNDNNIAGGNLFSLGASFSTL